MPTTGSAKSPWATARHRPRQHARKRLPRLARAPAAERSAQADARRSQARAVRRLRRAVFRVPPAAPRQPRQSVGHGGDGGDGTRRRTDGGGPLPALNRVFTRYSLQDDPCCCPPPERGRHRKPAHEDHPVQRRAGGLAGPGRRGPGRRCASRSPPISAPPSRRQPRQQQRRGRAAHRRRPGGLRRGRRGPPCWRSRWTSAPTARPTPSRCATASGSTTARR